MIKLAKIIQIEGTFIRVKLEKSNQCIDCKSHCSDGFLSFLFHKKNKSVFRINTSGTDNGDLVLIQESIKKPEDFKLNEVIGLKFDEKQFLSMAFWLYGMPIFIIIAFLSLGHYLFSVMAINKDIGGVLGLMLGLYFSKTILILTQSRMKTKVEFFK